MPLSSQTPCRILTYGKDEVLLKTRAALLNTVGIKTDTSRTADEFIKCITSSERGYDVFILCHSVQAQEQEVIIDAAKEVAVKVYALHGLVQPAQFLAHVQELVAAC